MVKKQLRKSVYTLLRETISKQILQNFFKNKT